MSEVAHRTGGLTLRSPRMRTIVRRTILLLAMLISGGSLLFPRPPILGLIVLLSALVADPTRLVRTELRYVWLILALILAVTIGGGHPVDEVMLITRYANFFGGIAILAIYLDEGVERFSNDIFPIVRLFAIQAILTPVMAILVPELFRTITVQDTAYETLGFVFTYHEFLSPAFLKRADGFFYEPGVLQIYANIFLFLTLFVRKFKWQNVAIAVGGVMATQSTTGLSIMMLQLAFAAVSHLRTASSVQRFLILVIAPALLAPLAYLSYQNFQDKFYGESQGSSWAREYDLRTGLAIIAERPLTGIGFDYDTYYDYAQIYGFGETVLSRETIAERSNSNGVITLLYSMGLPIGAMMLFGLFRQRLFRPTLLFSLIMFISLLSEALFLTPFMLFILFSGLAKPAATAAPRPLAARSRAAG